MLSAQITFEEKPRYLRLLKTERESPLSSAGFTDLSLGLWWLEVF